MESNYRAQGDGAGHTADSSPGEDFHQHLDKCDQCRNNPFDLCATGAHLLVEAVRKLDKE